MNVKNLSLSYFIRNFNRLIKYISRNIKISCLLVKKYEKCHFKTIWALQPDLSTEKERSDDIDIFTFQIPANNINWHKDYSSDYEYPLLRFDRLKFHMLFNKGVDVIFPWETSRCQFLIAWGQNYFNTGEVNYYYKFKNTILNWLKENPFLYGINWTSPMDASIRATNWIIACELFDEELRNDDNLKKVITISLQQHADFILKFMGKRHNNHAVSHYAGLLFITTFLITKRSRKLQKKAIKGLEWCMKSQVFGDGVDSEYALCYHRLVLEMFAFSAILSKANNIILSDRYYNSLFKMFEFTAAYIDHKGIAPQVGDNDSGRFLILDDSYENDHSYLLDIGLKIFDYNFLTLAEKRSGNLLKWLPDFEKVEVPGDFRITDKSISFSEGGFYFLKNDKFFVSVNGNAINKKSITGHMHFDFSSFTISFRGNPIIIDPGTYLYTPDLVMRNMFKGLESHNVSFPADLNPEIFKSKGYFGIGDKWPIISDLSFDYNQIFLKIIYGDESIERTIKLADNSIYVKDVGDSLIKSHLHTRLKFNIDGSRLISDILNIETNTRNIEIESSHFSERYGHISGESSRIILTGDKEINIDFLFK